ncbi:MAG: TonB-dependent receptor [Blastocatellia bacterium]
MLKLCAAIIFIIALASVAYGQSKTGTVRGVVTDNAGAIVQGAKVKLANRLTGYTQTTVTDEQGFYRMIDVPFGDYALEVEAASFAPAARDVTVRSNLAQQIDLQLGIAVVRQEVNITAASELLEPEKTGPATVLDRNQILRFPGSQPSRSAESLIATVPGWTLDANNRLHARGLEAQMQYSIDGIPVTDTIADTFAGAPDPRNFRSVEIATAYIPAEYGNKLGGVIAVTSRSGLEIPTSGSVTLSGGSFSTFETSFDAGGHSRRFGYFASGAGSTTSRFLDPPALENFHNDGQTAKGFFKFDYTQSEKNLFRLNIFAGYQRFDVPNLFDQQFRGQDQGRSAQDDLQSLSWEHIFSPDLTSYTAIYRRQNQARLFSNTASIPVFAEAARKHSNYGLLGSLTFHKGRHTVKTGFELVRFPVTESFTFAITDLDRLLEVEPALPVAAQGFTINRPFFFNQHRAGHQGSAYVQDHINATRDLTFDLGVRFDSYHFLVDKNYASPRLGVAYHVSRTRTVLRAAYNRFLQTPALENLLLSSSEEARIFSPGGSEGDEEKGSPVRPSREWQVDVGFQQQLAGMLRLDADFYYRGMRNPFEFTDFLETGIVFPATLDRSRSKGVEARLDLAPTGGLSGFLSYTNLRIYGFAPLTGGLFLGEAIELREMAGQRVSIEEDQRNTVVFQLLYDRLPGHVWAAVGGRHDSGYSIELDEESQENFERLFPAKILDRVNFERGFIKPHTVLDFSVGRDFTVNDHLSISSQFNVQNFADRFYLITFESLSSGAALGRPRSYSGKLSFNFK